VQKLAFAIFGELNLMMPQLFKSWENRASKLAHSGSTFFNNPKTRVIFDSFSS
jgi:hypothetical protein